MEPVSSPESTPLSFMPNFTLNQESDADKDSFVASTSSVNCFADVVVSQNYSDISRNVTLGGGGGSTFAVSSSGTLTCPVAVLNNSAAVVAVPESQLFTVPQPHPVDVIQHESDMPTDGNVSSMVPNVNDVHVTLSINVDPNSASLNGGGVLTDATQTASTTTTDSKKRKGGWPKGKKRKKEFGDLNKPKAPITGYVRFINSRRAEVKQQHPHLTFPEITKLLGAEWSNLLQEEKQKYLDEAEEDKKRYIEELKIYQQSEQYQAFMKRQSAKKIKGIVGVDSAEELPSNLLLGEQMVRRHERVDFLNPQHED
ncbi:PREDICTED: high mobility group protein 20A-like [Acropora digitifera]|uniref:high mobility group protein 20A-like n=1 Tax=Acropora digitifera TaxID=70779 RepID=UPI00077AA47D|nr:PREDICTED: high mobility group protein 20A-like [Acropora digitifera]